ncbi:MAG: YhdP family protein, partial [Halothiobacillaceae bacterium]
ALRIEQVSLTARDARGRDLELIRQGSLQARRDRGEWVAALQWHTDEAISPAPQKLRLRLDRGAAKVSGRAYLALSDLDLPAVQRRVEALFPGLLGGTLGGCPRPADETCAWALPRLDAGVFDGEAWLTLHDGRLRQVTSELSMRHLVATRVEERSVPVARSQFDRVSTLARWRLGPDAGDWSLLFDDLRVEGSEYAGADPQQVWLAQRGDHLHAGGERVDLSALRTWLAVSPLPAPMHELIAHTDVSGQVEHPVLVFAEGELEQGYLGLKDLQWSARGMVPGLQGEAGQGGLEAKLLKRPEGWVLELPRQRLSLQSAELFDAPLAPVDLAGTLFLEEGETRRLFSPDLRIDLAGLVTRSRLDLSFTPEGPVADIRADFEAAQAAALTSHLPVGVMDPNAVQWLRRALVGPGRIENGRFRLSGPLVAVPFHRPDDTGVFQVDFDYRDLDLAYDRQWLPAEGLGGHIRFVGNRFEARIEQGLVNGVRVLDGTVAIPRLERPHVDLLLSLRGPIAQQIGYLEASPVLSPDLLSAVRFGGEAELALDIFVPLLKRDGTTQVRGQLMLDESTLSLPAARLAVDRLRGTLDFHNERISGQNLGGLIDGEPVALAVDTRSEAGGMMTEIEARGAIDPLFAFRPADWTTPLSGRAEVAARIVIPHALRNEPVRVEADSALAGVALDLPAPFGKPASTTQATRLNLRLAPDGGRELALSLSERLAARLAWDEGEDSVAGALAFGSSVVPESAALPEAGFAVSGRIAPMDLAQWSGWFERQGQQRDQGRDKDQEPPSPSSEPSAYLPVSGTIRFDRLDLGQLIFPQADLDLDLKSPDRWQFDIDSDRSAGQLVLHRREGRVHDAEAHFARLWIGPAQEKSGEEPVPENGPKVSIAGWPNLRLSAADLRYDGRRLGSLSLEGRVSPQAAEGQYRWSIPELLITLPGVYSLQANGSVDEHEGGVTTALNVGAQSDDVGAMLQALSGGSAIEGGQLARAGLSLAWPGLPYAPRLLQMQGGGDFVIEAGRLAEVDAGAGRLLGLFSLGALARRLSLDFRDVFNQGFAFDSMVGRIALSEGYLQVDPLEIRSPSLLAVLEGSTDLRSEALDYQMQVYADVGMLLPIIGTVAGGPLVGGAVLLAQQLIRQSDEQPEPTMRYRIGGTIDKPVLERAGEGNEQ